MSYRSILVGDFNTHHTASGASNCDSRGNLINFVSSSFDTCILNNGLAYYIEFQ